MNSKQTLHQANLNLWAGRFHDQKSSGLTVKEWCSQNEVSIHAFYYWKGIAKETYVKSIIPDIVPVQAAPITPVSDSNLDLELYNSHESSNPSAPVSVSINDIRIEIGLSASDEMILRIIKAVRHA